MKQEQLLLALILIVAFATFRDLAQERWLCDPGLPKMGHWSTVGALPRQR
jgi:hypothetical protein